MGGGGHVYVKARLRKITEGCWNIQISEKNTEISLSPFEADRIMFEVPFYFPFLQVRSVNCYKFRNWRVEECTVALPCN
jgi:hypothetical protein